MVGALLVAPAPVAVATSAEVVDLYDPFVVRSLSLVMEPLEGWQPGADWAEPAGWGEWSADAQAQYLDEAARDAAWDVIRRDTTFTIVLPAMFSADGEEPLLVGVRRKSSRALPSETDPQKVGLKVGFTDVVSGQRWRGVTKLSLENGGDVSPIAEGLAWNLHQMAVGAALYPAGHDPGLAAWANVSVNGAHLGLFTSVEQRNKQFMRNRDLWTSGTTWLYEADDAGLPVVDEGPAPLPDGSQPHSPQFEQLCFVPFRPVSSACASPTDNQLATVLRSTIDMNAMLAEAAVDAFTANNDAMMSKGKNYHMVDRVGERRRYYPWDLDSVFGKNGSTSTNIYALSYSVVRNKRTVTQSPYQQVILNHPEFRVQYNQVMLALLDGPLAPSAISGFLDRVESAVTPSLEADPYVDAVIGTSVAGHFDSLRQWVADRAVTVRAQVAANVPAPRLPSVDRSATSIVDVGPASTVAGSMYALTARLSAGGAPVVGRTLTFVVNRTTYTAVTSATGVATASARAPTKPGSYSVRVSFAGDVTYAASSASATLSVVR